MHIYTHIYNIYIYLYLYIYTPKMISFINMLITRDTNRSPDMILTASDGKFHEKKMRYLPVPVDLQNR